MNANIDPTSKAKAIMLPMLFYFAFLLVIFLLMKCSVLTPDYVFIRFHLLTTLLLGVFLWAGRGSFKAAMASVAGVVAPVFIMVCWFLLKAFVLLKGIEWTEESFRGAISFSALFGVIFPIVFFEKGNFRVTKK